MAHFDFFLELGYPESEIVGMAQRALQGERLAAAEAAVAAAAEQTPATSVALPPSTAPNTGITCSVQPVAYRLLLGDAEQREALGETGQASVVCFPSKNLVLTDQDRLALEQLFVGLPMSVGFDPY